MTRLRMPRIIRIPRVPRIELVVGVGGSIVVLGVILAGTPGWDVLATVGATLLPASLVLYGAALARRARASG